MTYEEVKEYFTSRGCTLLTDHYEGIRTKLKYKAQCGHIVELPFVVFKQGKSLLCRKCNPNYHRVKKISIEELKKEYEDNGCVLLSKEYKGAKGYLDYICQCGHKHTMQYYCFKRGQGRKCPACSGNKKKTIDEVRRIFESKGCKLLSSEYKWNRQKVSYIAKCGHRNTIKASAFFEGEGVLCPACAKKEAHNKNKKYTAEDQRKILESKGCKLITPSKTTNDKMVYYAQCGHKHSMRIEYFLNGNGCLCPNCYTKNTSIGELIVKEVLDELGIKYQRQFKIFTGSKNFQRLDFYLPDFGVAVEYNGIQHYQVTPFFHRKNEVSSLQYQQEKDLMKLRHCQKHGIRIIYIDGRNWSQKRMVNGDLKAFIKGLFVNEGFVDNQMEFDFS